MKAFILTRDDTEGGACEDDALAYVNGDGLVQVERNGKTMRIGSAREARLLAYRLCKAAELIDDIDEQDRYRDRHRERRNASRVPSINRSPGG